MSDISWSLSSFSSSSSLDPEKKRTNRKTYIDQINIVLTFYSLRLFMICIVLFYMIQRFFIFLPFILELMITLFLCGIVFHQKYYNTYWCWILGGGYVLLTLWHGAGIMGLSQLGVVEEFFFEPYGQLNEDWFWLYLLIWVIFFCFLIL